MNVAATSGEQPADIPAAVKPSLRGVSHQLAFFASVLTGAILIFVAATLTAKIVAGVFAASVCLLFGVSALYHRINWTPEARARMRRLDHASIYILISGTYTPVMWLLLERREAIIILGIVWVASIIGVAIEVFLPRTPKWLAAVIYVAIGWAAIFVLGDLAKVLSPLAMTCIAGGGVSYTLGAVAYAFKRPNPWPAHFGYHEIFHLLVIVGAYLHYGVIFGIVRAAA